MPSTGRAALVLRDARRSALDRTWLTNVYPLYLHDLSAFDDGYYTLDERGAWHPDHLPSWLDNEGADDGEDGEAGENGGDVPLVVAVAGRRVGFALVNRAPSPHVPAGCDYRMSEFFVLARERGTGIGTRAAHAVFAMLPGAWEVSQLPRNERAIRFWRRVIAEAGAVDRSETVAADEVRQRFRIPAPPGTRRMR